MDWDPADLLEGLDDDARDGRRALLERLSADGVPEGELRRACAEDRLVLLSVERRLLGPPRYTFAEFAARSEQDPEWLARLRRALGLPLPGPNEPIFTDQDVEAARRIRTYLAAGLPEDDLIATIRVMAGGMARSAEVVRGMAGRALLEPGIGEEDLSDRYAGVADHLLPLVESDLAYLLRLHMRELLRQDTIGAAEMRSGELSYTEDVAVAFADVVGFTELGEEVDAEALGDVAARLLELTEQTVVAPVRLVKTIGDAVMLVSPDPAPLLDVLLDLVDAADADEQLPQLHAGIAFGPALQRFGDLYGSTVNTAARLCARARPGAVLASAEVRGAAGDGYDWSRAGPKRLKGLGGPMDTWRARRTAAAS